MTKGDADESVAAGGNAEGPTAPTKRTKAAKKLAKRLQLKEKRRFKRRQKLKDKRHENSIKRRAMLEAMGLEERRVFIHKEREDHETAEAERNIRLVKNLDDGRLQVVINCEFMDLMSQKEHTSLGKQIQWMWQSICREPTMSVKLTVAGWSDELAAICGPYGLVNWKMHLKRERVQQLFQPEQSIILSPDADESLTEEEIRQDANVFVIGGIVDRTIKKGETKSVAQRWRGCHCRRLPLEKCQTKVFPVLNINVVFEIIAAIKFRGYDWNRAIQEFTPRRRQHSLITDEDTSINWSSSESESAKDTGSQETSVAGPLSKPHLGLPDAR